MLSWDECLFNMPFQISVLEDNLIYVTRMNLKLKFSCSRNIQSFILEIKLKLTSSAKPTGPVRYSTLIILQTSPLPVLAPNPGSNVDPYAAPGPNAPLCYFFAA